MNSFKKANLSSTGGMLPVRWSLLTGQPLDCLFNFLFAPCIRSNAGLQITYLSELKQTVLMNIF
jgi:hypothetical protein